MDWFILFINNAPVLQLLMFILIALFWFLGMNYLKKKHCERLESQNIEFYANIRFENISLKEWFILVLFLLTFFGMGVFTISL